MAGSFVRIGQRGHWSVCPPFTHIGPTGLATRSNLTDSPGEHRLLVFVELYTTSEITLTGLYASHMFGSS
jgi:hypothetical protein